MGILPPVLALEMFKTQTVFILGAGTSVPFGFPSGEMLLRILTGAVSREDNSTDRKVVEQHRNLKRLLDTTTTDKTFTAEFMAKLAASSTPSIDTWLSQNLECMSFGKIAIAAVIANAEHFASSHVYEPDDWYKWLINKMLRNTQTIAQFLDNKVSFITFNYDRLLEWRLGQFINNFYRDEKKIKDAAIDNLCKRIVHVHGHLAFNGCDDLSLNIKGLALDSVPSISGGDAQQLKLREYGERARELSQSIRIIGENVDKDHEYSYTSLIQGADRIIFLGFGYDDRNLRLLRIDARAKQLLNRSFAFDWQIPIMGSAYRMGKAQERDVRAAIHGSILLGTKELSCVPFCDEYVSTDVL